MSRPAPSPFQTRGRSRSRSLRISVPRVRSRTPARAVAQIASYVVEKGKEMKTKGIYSGVTTYNAAASIAGDIVRVIPDISQGDGDSNRDGRKIKLHKHVMKGCVAVSNTNYSDLYVDIWMVEDKWQKNFLNVDAASAFLVLRNNSNVPTNPGGSTFWSEVGFQLNRDRFIIKRKRIKLGFNAQPQNAAAGTSDPTVSVMRTFTFTRKWKKGKSLTYYTDADTMPNNYNTYMFFSVGSYDETYYGSLSSATVKASVNSTMYFKEK